MWTGNERVRGPDQRPSNRFWSGCDGDAVADLTTVAAGYVHGRDGWAVGMGEMGREVLMRPSRKAPIRLDE